MLKGDYYGKSADLFSIGVVAYLCLSGCLPFDDDFSEQEIARQTMFELTPFPQSTWYKFTEEAKDCIDSK